MGKTFEHHKSEIEGVIHSAAYKAVEESVEQPLRYYDNNTNPLTTLLHCMERYGVQHLVFSSSRTVYGQPTAEHLPIIESVPRQDITSSYDSTKHINGDTITGSVRSDMPLQAVVLRYFNPIGVRPSALIGEEPMGTPQNFIPFLTQTVVGLRKELVVFGNGYNTLDGTCTRDHTDVMDLARIHSTALRRLHRSDIGSTPAHYIYNVGMGRELDVLELIQAFERATEHTVSYRIDDHRTSDVEWIWADMSYGEQELQQHTEIPIGGSLRRTWHWRGAPDK